MQVTENEFRIKCHIHRLRLKYKVGTSGESAPVRSRPFVFRDKSVSKYFVITRTIKI